MFRSQNLDEVPIGKGGDIWRHHEASIDANQGHKELMVSDAPNLVWTIFHVC